VESIHIEGRTVGEDEQGHLKCCPHCCRERRRRDFSSALRAPETIALRPLMSKEIYRRGVSTVSEKKRRKRRERKRPPLRRRATIATHNTSSAHRNWHVQLNSIFRRAHHALNSGSSLASTQVGTDRRRSDGKSRRILTSSVCNVLQASMSTSSSRESLRRSFRSDWRSIAPGVLRSKEPRLTRLRRTGWMAESMQPSSGYCCNSMDRAPLRPRRIRPRR
jgi:hypothetical protein